MYGYEVRWSGNTDGDFVEADQLAYVVTGLKPGAAVVFEVRAVAFDGETASAFARANARAATDTRKPVAVGAPKVQRMGARGIQVSWAAARDDHRVATYRVLARVGATWKPVGSTAGRVLKLRGVPRGATQIAVQPVDAAGNVGARSKPAKIPAVRR